MISFAKFSWNKFLHFSILIFHLILKILFYFQIEESLQEIFIFFEKRFQILLKRYSQESLPLLKKKEQIKKIISTWHDSPSKKQYLFVDSRGKGLQGGRISEQFREVSISRSRSIYFLVSTTASDRLEDWRKSRLWKIKRHRRPGSNTVLVSGFSVG